MRAVELERFLCPESVAVVGASKTPGTIGNTTIKNFADVEFKGRVYGVNPRYGEIEGFPCYPSLSVILDQIDVVIIAVASNQVEKAIGECVEKKVNYVIILSSGFAEKSDVGLIMQNNILDICRQNGIRVLGPNTMGLYNFKDRILLTFSPPVSNFMFGELGIVTQSGATGGFISNYANGEQVGVSYMITTGNQMDLTSLDILDFLVEDEDTKLIATYLEAVPDVEKFKEICARALSIRKPVIALKAGRSSAGKIAALSHTASLTGSYQDFEKLAERYGITLVNEIEEIIDAVKALRGGKRPQGNRVATVVISGATGVLLADKLPDFGLEMAILSETTQNILAEVVPGYCNVANPVDIALSLLGNEILYKHCIETLVLAEEVDIVIVQLPLPDEYGFKFAQDILEVAKKSDKPIIVATTGLEQTMGEVRKFLTQNNIPAYNTLKSAAQAAYYLLNYEISYNFWKDQFCS
ncbi:MAG: acetate--CoA ligase family protein [Bacillota bacterium]